MNRIARRFSAPLVLAAAVAGCSKTPVTPVAVAPPNASNTTTDELLPSSNTTTDETLAAPVDTAQTKAETDKPAPAAADSQEQPKPAATEIAAAPAKPSISDSKPSGKSGDWNQWGGSTVRNNTPAGENIPDDWEIGDFDKKTGDWQPGTGKNIKWVAKLGSQTYGNPVIANGKVYVGTNNGAGWLKRYPADTDLGCLLCFNEADGKFLWQHSSEKLPTGRVHDWPLQGICCSPYVESDRLWFVTSRGEVLCLDPEGFHDGENDGPFKEEKSQEKDEADVIWSFNMMKELGVSQHNMCSCSVTALGDTLFVCTSNGVDESHVNLPAPGAPSFITLDKNSGKVIWTDKSPGMNILHGQWSSPCVAELGGVPQVIFAGGDAWLYSFHATEHENGAPKLLWKFDANPKESKYILGGRGTRNEIIATPVAYEGLIYLAVGQDPEHGEGEGHLWCIDPTKRGDISAELAFNVSDTSKPIPHKRLQAVVKEEGDVARPNPNSGVVWHYGSYDLNGDGKAEDFEETMHRTIGTVTIKKDDQGNHLLFLADFSGLFHCVDAKTGKPHWTYDMLACSWGSALVVDGKVYIGDEDGDVAIFRLSPEKSAAEPLNEISMGNSVLSSAVVANNVLFIANRTHLFAIEEK
ncbi:MAG: PQQ-binding-like beta-propeller repeat protein [Planctomycetes bacterium]|nr:PQQ-binding-like beta-propeller repeat protein [Planctomycetota bacterium]